LPPAGADEPLPEVLLPAVPLDEPAVPLLDPAVPDELVPPAGMLVGAVVGAVVEFPDGCVVGAALPGGMVTAGALSDWACTHPLPTAIPAIAANKIKACFISLLTCMSHSLR
jgi:hypothetical protein